MTDFKRRIWSEEKRDFGEDVEKRELKFSFYFLQILNYIKIFFKNNFAFYLLYYNVRDFYFF